MCELLIKTVDATHPDPKIDSSSCFKKNDVIAVKEDGFSWGASERNSSIFSIVKMPGIPASQMEYLLNRNIEPLPNSAAMKISALRKELTKKERKTLNCRRFSIDPATKQLTDKARK